MEEIKFSIKDIWGAKWLKWLLLTLVMVMGVGEAVAYNIEIKPVSKEWVYDGTEHGGEADQSLELWIDKKKVKDLNPKWDVEHNVWLPMTYEIVEGRWSGSRLTTCGANRGDCPWYTYRQTSSNGVVLVVEIMTRIIEVGEKIIDCNCRIYQGNLKRCLGLLTDYIYEYSVGESKDVTSQSTITVSSATYKVTPKTLTITCNDAKEHDGTLLVSNAIEGSNGTHTNGRDCSFTYDGLVSGERVNDGSFTTTSADEGTYKYAEGNSSATGFSIKKANGNPSTNNYTISYVSTQKIVKKNGFISRLIGTNNLKCYDGNDGSITFEIKNYNKNYTYFYWLVEQGDEWNRKKIVNENSLTLDGLKQGSYTLRVYRVSNNESWKTFQYVSTEEKDEYNVLLSSPEELKVSIVKSGEPCYNVPLTLTANVQGGVEDYSYLWTPSSGLSSTNTQSVSLTPTDNSANYTVKVTDANGCEKTVSTDDLKIQEYNVKVTKTGNCGNVKIKDLTTGNTVNTWEKVKCGHELEFTAEVSCCTFKYWDDDKSSDKTKRVVVTGDVEVFPVFDDFITINVTVEGNGSVILIRTGDGNNVYQSGAPLGCNSRYTVTAMANGCNRFIGWEGDLPSGASATATMLDYNPLTETKNLKAKFESIEDNLEIDLQGNNKDISVCVGEEIDPIQFSSNNSVIAFSVRGDATGLHTQESIHDEDKKAAFAPCTVNGVFVSAQANVYDKKLYINIDPSKFKGFETSNVAYYDFKVYKSDSTLYDHWGSNVGPGTTGSFPSTRADYDFNETYTLQVEIYNNEQGKVYTERVECESHFTLAGGYTKQDTPGSTLTISGTPTVVGDIVYTLTAVLDGCSSSVEDLKTVTIHVKPTPEIVCEDHSFLQETGAVSIPLKEKNGMNCSWSTETDGFAFTNNILTGTVTPGSTQTVKVKANSAEGNCPSEECEMNITVIKQVEECHTNP